MPKADQKTKTAADAPQQAPASQLPAPMTIQLRLPYPKSAGDVFGVSQSDWIVLTDVIFPNATNAASILLALRYCKARQLDVMKKVINIVPMYSKALGKMVDTVWPGIAEVRITATRTGDYAGRDEEKFGPDIQKRFKKGKNEDGSDRHEEICVPEWCQLTVYKIVRGQRCAFVGPKVFWEEAYATAGRDTDAPNEMWTDRKRGQVSKCAEAASLRAAFPEETGGMLTAEEMHGRVLDGDINPETMVVQDDTIVPPRPKQSDFAPKPTVKEKDKGITIMAGGHDVTDRISLTKAELKKQRAEKEACTLGQGIIGDTNEPVDGSEQRQEPEPEHVEPEPEEVNEAPTAAFITAMEALDNVEKTIIDIKDLEALKKEGRSNIDKEPGLTEDERDELRARFTTILLTEQRRRAQKGRR